MLKTDVITHISNNCITFAPSDIFPWSIGMRKFLYLLLVIFLSVLSVGCNKSDRKYRIGVSQCCAESWRWKTNDEIMREKLFHDDVDVEIRCADDSDEKQIDDIKYFIDNGFDIIIVNPTDYYAVTPIIRQAYESGIPVITFDRRIDGENYTVHMEVDNEKIGQSVARYALHLFPSGNVKVIELQGTASMSPTKKRHSDFADEIGLHPRFNVVADEYADWNPEIAAAKTDSQLNLYPDVNLIYAHSDKMAIAAA